MRRKVLISPVSVTYSAWRYRCAVCGNDLWTTLPAGTSSECPNCHEKELRPVSHDSITAKSGKGGA